MIVVTSSAVTVSVAREQSMTTRHFVTVLVTTAEYLMVAIAAPVMGKVYAHQVNENLKLTNVKSCLKTMRNKRGFMDKGKLHIPDASEEINTNSL